MGVVDGNKEHTLKIEKKVQLPHGNPGASYLRPGFVSRGSPGGAGGRAGAPTQGTPCRPPRGSWCCSGTVAPTGEGAVWGAGRGLLPEPLPVPKTRVSGKPQGRSRVPGRCGTLGRWGLGASPLPSLPWSRTRPCSEHQPAMKNDSIASPRKWEADFQVRGTKMTCIT